METATVVLGILCFSLAIAVIYLIVRLRFAYHTEKLSSQKLDALENKVNDLQLETLESRLSPHLFKNILNSIQSHAYQTYFALDKLGNVLDYILYESRKRFVSPRQEIAFALNLIEINKIKVSPLFDLRVKTKINESDALFSLELLAPMVVIDLIENAFKHADLQSADSFISVLFEFDNGTIALTVSNKISDRAIMKKERSGIGVNALEKRLEIIYKQNFKLERFVENDTYTAYLKIDLRGFKTPMPAH